MGSAESILDLLICPKCAVEYRLELMPKIEKMVREYFQPERSKREDVCETYGHLWGWTAPLIKSCGRCGALNSMET